MTSRTALFLLFFCFTIKFPLFSQQSDQLADIIDQAKVLYLQNNYQEAASQLNKALELLNNKLITRLIATFPEPLGGWRAEEAHSSINTVKTMTSLNVKRSYFKKGGGPSVDIKMETNSIRIGSIKMLFASPAMVKRAGNNIEITTVADKKCLLRQDPIDKYVELTFVPSSTVIVTVIGQDMKDTKTVIKYAEKINWNDLESTFP